MGVTHSRDKEKLKNAHKSKSSGVKHVHVQDQQSKGDNQHFEDVVISGLSCRLPESDNMAEFRDNLLNGVDMVTEDNRRWEPGIYGLPKANGKLKDLTKFDNVFFGVSPKQAETMDPQLRMLLEVAYEAIMDAGQCPDLIKGSNTGVFIGTGASESHDAWGSDPQTVSGYTMTGCYKSMFANRLSYFFDIKGPSLVLDTACSSSFHALHFALQSIRSGQCDAALVCGSHLCLNPSYSVQFQKLGMLATDGKCKSFDENADGYGRSEAVVVVFLQKATDARRIYCHVVNTGANSDGNKTQGITYPSSDIQVQLLQRIYNEVNLDPSIVSYVEAHGTGTQAGDMEEAKTLSNFFCRSRKEPLLIGSVKSNMGHCETVSGLASIAKVIVAMEEGVIPANLHCQKPNQGIEPILHGQLRVVDKNIVWTGGYVGINNFGFGGSNSHVILKSHNKTYIEAGPKLERKLICCCSRTEEGVKRLIQESELQSTNDEFLSLVCETARQHAKTQLYRGFKILNGSSENTSLTDTIDSRPVWYVFTGMGCQWPGMGRQMMSIGVFRKAISRCATAVSPYGIDLVKIISNETTYEDVTLAFVAIIAIQVALVDLLKSVGVKPDGYIGHSVGEIACAYADGCFTAAEAVHVAYWRGTCIKKANLPLGAMAVIGVTWEEALAKCPSGVVPACYNASDSVTVSGAKQAVEEFVKEMKQQGVFAKEVNSVGIAFHSFFMKKAERNLYNVFSRVIRQPKPRSDKWISTSTNESTDTAKYSSPEYHVNNVLSPVLFHEALQHVPRNAIVIEIAPHCLLKPILKRSLSTDCYITELMNRSNMDNKELCFSNIGNLYLKGVNITPHTLLEPVMYPGSRGTPMIAPLIAWRQEDNWQVPTSDMFAKTPSVENNRYIYEVDSSKDAEWSYISGHKIDGRVLFPAAGYLYLVWKSYMKLLHKPIDQAPVSFEDVQFQRATVLPDSGKVKFDVMLMPGTGTFEINEGGSVVASGRFKDNVSNKSILSPNGDTMVTNMTVSSNDIYKELRLRGYEYGGLFKGIMKTDVDGKRGFLRWSGHFVAFIDTMLQFTVLSQPTLDLRLPTRLKSVSIYPELLLRKQQNEDVYVEQNINSGICQSLGIKLFNKIRLQMFRTIQKYFKR